MMFAPVYITLAPLQYSQSGVSLYPRLTSTRSQTLPVAALGRTVTDLHIAASLHLHPPQCKSNSSLLSTNCICKLCPLLCFIKYTISVPKKLGEVA